MTAHAAYACQAQPGIEESRARFDEALDFILAAAWTNDSFSFDGKYLQARELTVVPRPVQTPHPPVRIAANSPDTFPLAARHRLPIFASPLINPPDKLKAGLVVYRRLCPPAPLTTPRWRFRCTWPAAGRRPARNASRRFVKFTFWAPVTVAS
jgi:alkanesulfonate monooxygenase SsuD/methylene tetrahydromethanopterin reductase-like flavin-dependent oxidoreductase (luciferase family)